MSIAALLVLGALLVACGRRADSDGVAETTAAAPPAPTPAASGDTTVLVVVDRPTVVGFFPPARDSASTEEDGYSEGLAHVEFALEDARACLGRDSSRVAMVVDTAIRVRRSARTDTLRFTGDSSYGVWLIAPDREPRLVHVSAPSALISAVTEAVPEYFGRPPCDVR